MYVRQPCNIWVHLYKELLRYGNNRVTNTYPIQNKNVRLTNHESTPTVTKRSDFPVYPTKSIVFMCQVKQFSMYRTLQDKKDYENPKTTQKVEENRKPGIKPTIAESKNIGTAKENKPPPNLKSKSQRSLIRSHKISIIAAVLGVTSLVYVTRLVVDPITGRKKFHLFSENQVKTLGKINSDHYMNKYKDQIQTSGPNYNRISKIVGKLMQANSDLVGAGGWTVYVVDRGDVVNMYALADGAIFVFSGLLDAVPDDDHLAAAVSHVVAHVLLSHPAEVPTWRRLLLSALVHLLLTLQQALPLGAIVHPVLRRLSVLTMKTPMGKKLEREADGLSVEMVSKACFDPRKIREFWTAMEGLRKKRRVKVLGAHPNDKARNHDLDRHMPKAFNILSKRCTGGLHPFFR